LKAGATEMSNSSWFLNQTPLLSVDPHAVVTHLGVEDRFERKEVLLEGVLQVEHRLKGNRVVTTRDRDPRIVVRGQRTLQVCLDLQVVALLADSGPLGLVTGQAEVVDIHGGRFQPVAEGYALLLGVHLVDRDLRRSGACKGREGPQSENQAKFLHRRTERDFQRAKL